MRGDAEQSSDVVLRGKELQKIVNVEGKKSGWTQVQVNNLMTALLQEAEDILQQAEQQCLEDRQWQELVNIEEKKTELSKVTALPPDALGQLNVKELVDCMAAFEKQIAAYVPADSLSVLQQALHQFGMQKSVVGDSEPSAKRACNVSAQRFF